MHDGTPSITFTRIWHDDDVVELAVKVRDDASSFTTNVYVGHQQLKSVVEDLEGFRTKVHGGLYDLTLGGFGPEYANGAFHARFHFRSPGRLYVSTRQESDFTEFAVRSVASEAKLYLVTEPILLDNFISELACLASESAEQATLECLPNRGGA
jgi:hypothetical protein